MIERIASLRSSLASAFPVEPLPIWPEEAKTLEDEDFYRVASGLSWNRVDPANLIGCWDSIVLLTAEVFRYYLPAFIDALLADWERRSSSMLCFALVESVLTYTESDSIASALTQDQRDGVAEFLRFVADDEGFSSDASDAAVYRLAADDWTSKF